MEACAREEGGCATPMFASEGSPVSRVMNSGMSNSSEAVAMQSMKKWKPVCALRRKGGGG